MRESPLSRRKLLFSAALAGVGLSTPLWAADPSSKSEDESFPKDGAEALERLKAGNARFADEKLLHANQSAEWRKNLIGGQRPIATLLGCSDSRVPPELLFDQGFGTLFVVRVAGNVVSPEVIGSIAYAALHLRTPLFVVMGHASCGAVKAALDVKLKQAKDKEPEAIEALLKLIEPGLKDLDVKLASGDLLNAAVEANVRWSVKQLRDLPGAKKVLEKGGGAILVGAVYDLDSGKVRFLKD